MLRTSVLFSQISEHRRFADEEGSSRLGVYFFNLFAMNWGPIPFKALKMEPKTLNFLDPLQGANIGLLK